jgi:hypothetical protein
MRAGVGPRNPQSRRTVAVRLHTTIRRIARAERRGLRQLRSSARAGRCGGAAPGYTPAASSGAPPSAGGGDDGATLVPAAAEREARADARPAASGVKDEFRTSGPRVDPATLLPPPGDATEPPVVLLLTAAFVAGFVAVWALERRRIGPRRGPPAPGRP